MTDLLAASAAIMMSGIGGVDPRAKKLDNAAELWKFEIDDVWNIRIKIASDVDNSQSSAFNNSNGGYLYHAKFWNLYFCVYMGNSFMYSVSYNNWRNKIYTNYFSWEYPPNIVAGTEEIGSFSISSGNISIRNSSSSYLNVSVNGSYVRTNTSYSWDGTKSHPSGSDTYTNNFSASTSDFNGGSSSMTYIANGDAKFFKDAVNGLYIACRSTLIT